MLDGGSLARRMTPKYEYAVRIGYTGCGARFFHQLVERFCKLTDGHDLGTRLHSTGRLHSRCPSI